jgi:hypothetical protein
MSDANKGTQLLQTLASANGYVALALQVGGMLVPIGKALVKDIRSIGAAQETVTYEVLLQMDASELATVDQLAIDDLTAINAELAQHGIPPIPIPSTSAPASTGDHATTGTDAAKT